MPTPQQDAERALSQWVDRYADELGPVQAEHLLQLHSQDVREMQTARVTVDDINDS